MVPLYNRMSVDDDLYYEELEYDYNEICDDWRDLIDDD